MHPVILPAACLLAFVGCTSDGAYHDPAVSTSAARSSSLPGHAEADVEAGALHIQMSNPQDWITIKEDGDGYLVKTKTKPTWHEPGQEDLPDPASKGMTSLIEKISREGDILKYVQGSRIIMPNMYFEAVLTCDVNLRTGSVSVSAKSRDAMAVPFKNADDQPTATAHYRRDVWVQP